MVVKFFMKPNGERLVKIDNVHRHDNNQYGVFHIQFYTKPVKYLQAYKHKEYGGSNLCDLRYKVEPDMIFKIVADEERHMQPAKHYG